MTLRIEITVPEALVADGTGSAYLGRAMSTLGYRLNALTDLTSAATATARTNLGFYNPSAGTVEAAGPDDIASLAERPETYGGIERSPQSGWGTASAEAAKQDAASDPVEAPKRERGKPGEGRARRTKAEIAEDEAADAADAAALEERKIAIATGSTAATIGGHPASEEDAEKLGISTGEARVGPEDDAATQAQDAADEQAEAAASAPDDKPATLDDIRNALGDYVKLFGMAAAQEDGPKVISLVCGDGVTQISKIPDDKVAKALAGVKEMIEKNPFKRASV